MKYVLVTLSGGILDEVTFFDKQEMAISSLSEYVKTMDPDDNDAGVFSREGMISNAKTFLDENDQYVEKRVKYAAILEEPEEPIYLIGNPHHRLGFMVASPDDPMGYEEPVSAISDLGQMRQDYGGHLKLYRATPVTEPVTAKADLEQHNSDCGIEDFDYSIIEEYLIKSLA